MAKGNTRRTYKLTEDTVQIIEYLADHSSFDKSDIVDRATKYYWRDFVNGELDDPAIQDALDDISELPADAEGDDSKRSLIERIRGENK